ncbi:MAG: kynureninase [Pseudomonadota bacterium]
MLTLEVCRSLDQCDPLRECRRRFSLPDGLIYLDGNSLGALPAAAAGMLHDTVEEEWGQGLISSWNDAGWFDLPVALGDAIGELIGAGSGQTVVCDSVSTNLFKAVHAALQLRPDRHTVVAEGNNFPTDLYIIEGVKSSSKRELVPRLTDGTLRGLDECLDQSVAVVVLSQVNFQTGAMLDLERVTRACHDVGAVVVWDLCHSAGVIPIALDDCLVDFAVGCTYKFLNSGPGAPAYIYVADRHLLTVSQPLSGWWGHVDPFAFELRYRPNSGIRRYLCGTQPVLSMQAVHAGIGTYCGVDMDQVREKSIALGEMFVNLMGQECQQFDWTLASPDNSRLRGSQVSFRCKHGYAMIQALIDRGVVGDYREPGIMRFGFSPLYVRYVDIWEAVQAIRACFQEKVWLQEEYLRRKTVT